MPPFGGWWEVPPRTPWCCKYMSQHRAGLADNDEAELVEVYGQTNTRDRVLPTLQACVGLGALPDFSRGLCVRILRRFWTLTNELSLSYMKGKCYWFKFFLYGETCFVKHPLMGPWFRRAGQRACIQVEVLGREGVGDSVHLGEEAREEQSDGQDGQSPSFSM